MFIVTKTKAIGIGIEYTSWSYQRILTLRVWKITIDIYLKKRVKK